MPQLIFATSLLQLYATESTFSNIVKLLLIGYLPELTGEIGKTIKKDKGNTESSKTGIGLRFGRQSIQEND